MTTATRPHMRRARPRHTQLTDADVRAIRQIVARSSARTVATLAALYHVDTETIQAIGERRLRAEVSDHPGQRTDAVQLAAMTEDCL